MESMESPQALEETVRWLTGNRPAPVLLLSGEPGSGRSELLAAAARKAAEQGAPAAILHLDLAGFEEGPEGLVGFLSLWGQRHRAETDDRPAERLERVAEWVAELPPSMASAILLSLLLETESAVDSLYSQDPRQATRRLLERLTATDRVILHVTRSSDLDAVTRRWLLAEAPSHPNLLLALSCDPRDSDDTVAPRTWVRRVSLVRTPRTSDVLLEPLKDLMGRVDFRAAELLGRFIDLAALCGENVPSDLLMAYLEVSQEEREQLLDLIDEGLVQDEDSVEDVGGRLFLDLQYGHPSFHGLLTYSFVTPALRQDLLDHVPPAKRKGLAGELLSFLRERVPVATRGLAQLFLSLADHLEDAGLRRPCLRMLDWWISPGDEDALSSLVGEDLAAARLDPKSVLEAVSRTAGTWPPPHRLALLAAVESSSQGRAILGDVRYLRAAILRETGNPTAALEETRRALEAAEAGGGSALTGAILTLSGVLSGDLGDFQESRRRFEQSLAVHRTIFGDSHPAIAACLANLAALHRHLGEREPARELFAQAFEMARETQGEEHPFTQALGKALEELGG
jgi:tetratricopeptide (TPR) repeat protein